jgi:arylsulfatase
MKPVFNNKTWELFDLSKDRNESNDLSAQYPEKLQEMKRMWAEWYHSTDTGK